MLIALLAVLGVDLWVIVVLLPVVLARKRYGHWVRDILVWTKAPFLFRNELVPADALAGEARGAKPGEVRRLGKHPTVVLLVVDGGARIEVAASADRRERAPGPFGEASARTRS